jgi:hypothetical protein
MNNYHSDEEDVTEKYIAAHNECRELIDAVFELQEQIRTLTSLAERKTELINRFFDEVEYKLYGRENRDIESIEQLRTACQIYRTINNIHASKNNHRERSTG